MNRKLLALFLVLLMAFLINGQSVAVAGDAQEVKNQTVRDVGKGTDGYFMTPEGEVAISSRAYANNTKLVYVIVADSVKTIEDEAFAGCVNLRYVYLPKSVTSLGKNVFKGCPRFYWKKGLIAEGMTVACEKGISTNVLDQLYDQELQIDMVVRDAPPISGGPIMRYPQVGRPWGFPLFRYTVTKKTDTVREVTLKDIQDTQKSRKSLSIPDTVTIAKKIYKVVGIEKNAFKGMKKLKTVTVGKNVKKIDKNAFRNCKKLNTVKIKSKNCTFSGKGMWKGTSKKLTVKVPKSSLKKMQKRLKKTGLKKSAVKAL
ncbi:MAG: leucine-rich repeat domain-containing protein [Lachnospiraceae bacterium]|nr:leucine-rich repeat domain-containing protein [Lachnospiraceae bacterium]